MSTRRTQFSGKLTPAMLVDFLKKNGRSSAADVRKNFGGVDSTCRKHLTLAVDAGFIRREKEGNLAFYAAAENPQQIVRKKNGNLRCAQRVMSS